MNNQIKGRRKATFQKEEKVMTKGAGYCEKSITSGLCITGLGCTRFSRNERVSWKPDAESLERNSKSSNHYVHATWREYPVQERTIAWKNTGQTSTSTKSLRYKIRGSVPRRDWKTGAMCPKQGLGSCQTCIQAQSERHGYILLECRKVRSPKWSLYAYGQWRKTFTLLSWSHEDIEESDDGDDGQRRGANQGRSRGICSVAILAQAMSCSNVHVSCPSVYNPVL